MLTQPLLTSSRQMSRAGTEEFCCCSCCCPPIAVVCRAQCISSRRITSSGFQEMVSEPQICSQSQKPTYSGICQITFNNVAVRKAFNTNSNHMLCQGEKTLERSIEAWFPMHISIPQSLTVFHVLVHLHLKHNYIQSKITVHEFIPYLPSSLRKVISSYWEQL